MKSTTSINLNLQLPNYSVAVYAVQGDTMSREIEAALFDGQTPFTPPAGALGTVRYYKPDGTSGFYDTLEDEETVAVTWDDNVATIRLAEQTVTVPGEVLVQLSFYSADAERLSAFTFRLFVEKNPYSDQEFESTDYYSVLTARIAAVLNVTTHAPSINELGHWVLWNDETQQYYDSGINATGPQGLTGPTGPYMASIAKVSGTGAAGTTDQYQVTLSDGTHPTGTISVYNGSDGQGSPGSATPLMDGTASVGSANAYAREDHVHPSDTSRASAADFSDLQADFTALASIVSDLQTKTVETGTNLNTVRTACLIKGYDWINGASTEWSWVIVQTVPSSDYVFQIQMVNHWSGRFSVWMRSSVDSSSWGSWYPVTGNEYQPTVCNVKPGRYINSSGGETVWYAYYVAEIPVQQGSWIMIQNSPDNDATYNMWVDISGYQVGSLIQNRSVKGWGQAYQVPNNAVALRATMYNNDRMPLIRYTSS